MKTITHRSQAATALVLFVLAATLEAFDPSLARGAPPPAEEPLERAKVAAAGGRDAYDAGKYADAVRLFEEAYRLYPVPQYGLYLARSLAESGRLLQAKEVYGKVASTKLPADAKRARQEAVEFAATELVDLAKRIPTIQIVVSGAPADGAQVLVDDVTILPSMLARVEVNPGKHRIVLSREVVSGRGQRSLGEQKRTEAVSRILVVDEGKHESIELRFGDEPAPPPPSPPSARRESTERGLRSGVAFGIGLAGVGVGGVSGALALSLAKRLQAHCPQHRCPPAEQQVFDAASTLAMTSTVGFVTGGVGLATGTTLLFLPKDKVAPTVTVLAGPGSLAVEGAF